MNHARLLHLRRMLVDEVLSGERRYAILRGDLLELLPFLPDGSCDLCFTSPPYEDCRVYGELDFQLKGEDWVTWAKEGFEQCVRATKGLTAWVVEGKTRSYRYTMTPFLLASDLHRSGMNMRKPPIYQRVGIPGSGGPDWLRNDYEPIICATRKGKLPWSDNTACGSPPKYGPGGAPSHRLADGTRINAKLQTRRKANGDRARDGLYRPPSVANPGNIFNIGAGGGGNIGSKLAHENEAPFAEALAEFYVKSFCSPDGIVIDPFGGSGTTLAVALKNGRRCITFDLREDQCMLMQRRVLEVPAALRGEEE